MRREELYLADLIDNVRAVRGYLDELGLCRIQVTHPYATAMMRSDLARVTLGRGRFGFPGIQRKTCYLSIVHCALRWAVG
jgi:hypothetical protein